MYLDSNFGDIQYSPFLNPGHLNTNYCNDCASESLKIADVISKRIRPSRQAGFILSPLVRNKSSHYRPVNPIQGEAGA